MRKKFSYERLIILLDELNPKLDTSGKNLIVDCPWCKHREASVSLVKEGNLFGCLRKKRCGETGNIYRVLREIGMLDEYIKDPDTFNINLNHIDLDLHNKPHELILDVPECPIPLGWTQTFDDQYLNERGFNIEDYKKYPVGKTNLEPSVKKDYVIFLVIEDEKIKGWVARHIWPKEKIEEYNEKYFLDHGIPNKIRRYRNALNVDFAKLLYGIDEITENTNTVILVEGIFDKKAIDTKMGLYDQQEIKCLATFKGHVSDEQIAKLKLKGIENIILFYDPDVIDKIKNNSLKLNKFFDIQIAISINGKDPDEMSQDELFACLTKLYSPSVFYANFVKLKVIKF